ncbi:LysM domain-containing GPI-anchored protein 1 [Striga asiatica]|uniref:LysM domain-containing GPI-anchored protein 1 n=1 Tax=Striga asiatica TaxID=4170 RepID=A0A5A7Q8G1_STRAF|nr:LysM domain-containing GPI-anchored protein 1 [Striga asiatica]
MRAPTPALLLILLAALCAFPPRAAPKSTIDPCSDSGVCSALVGYTLYTDLKVSQVASLFAVDPIALLLANAFDASIPDVENHILPSDLLLKVPVRCACLNGIRQAAGVTYRTLASDTAASISGGVYGGLVSPDQISSANPHAGITDAVIPAGTQLSIPLPCTCFNNTDNNLPAVYMSYVVNGSADTLSGIAASYQTTVTDLMNVNNMASQDLEGGDILAIPLSACASNFPIYAEDYGLVVPNGSYAITASHCVLCSCGSGSRNLYCEPAPLAVSCSSMQCPNSNLMIGNVTAQQSAGGCNVTSCSYSGFVNKTISATLSTYLQPRCPEFQCEIVDGVLAPTPISYSYTPFAYNQQQGIQSGKFLSNKPRNKRKSEGDEPLSFRLFKFMNGAEEYIIEVHEVSMGIASQSHIRVFEQEGAWRMPSTGSDDLGNHMVQPWSEDPDPPLFIKNAEASLQERLTGWTLEKRQRSNGKHDMFYYHRRKQYRSFYEMATFILYANKRPEDLQFTDNANV